MLAKGNGNLENCINNLVHIFRGEVPFERAMGLNRAYIGKVSGIEFAKMTVDTKRMLKAYEPRADIDNIKVKTLLAGDYQMEVVLKGDE